MSFTCVVAPKSAFCLNRYKYTFLNKILTYKSVNSSQETWFGLSMVTRINKGYTLLISKGSLWCWIFGRDKWRKKLPGKERCSVVMKLVSCAESWLESELNLKLHGFS